MFTINVSSNLAQYARAWTAAAQKQLDYAKARALTMTAKDVQAEETRQLDVALDRPTPFTKRAFGVTMATKQTLTATVYIKDIQAKYLRLQIEGGVRFPAKRALVLPTDYPTDVYGNLPRGAVKRLLKRRDVFSGKVHGIPGLWQRTGRGLVLLIAYEPKATYRKRFDFYGIGRRVVDRRIGPNFEAAWKLAQATAR